MRCEARRERSADEEAARLWRADGLSLSEMWRPGSGFRARSARSCEMSVGRATARCRWVLGLILYSRVMKMIAVSNRE